MGELTPLDVQRAIAELACYLPGISVAPVRKLGAEWTFDPQTRTVWVEDAAPCVVAARALAGLAALARHFDLPRPRHLRLAPPPEE